MSSRYDILESLGEGGAGTVHKAWDRRLERYVAIKRLLPPDQRDGDGVGTDLQKEAGALSSLQHPNIVSVFDMDEMDGAPIVVMEFLNGETLEQTLRRGALTLGDFASVARQSLEGLIAAHRLGVQHRDIKPSNIMVSWLPNGDFLVKVLDFGLAEFSARPRLAAEEAGGEIFGAVHFVAPEQILHEPVDVRTDLYSLGCVFYNALTGAYPFDGRSMQEIADAHLKGTPMPVIRLRGDVPPAISQWVSWLMHRRPECRPASAEEALNTFLKIQAGTIKSLNVAPVNPKAATSAAVSKSPPSVQPRQVASSGMATLRRSPIKSDRPTPPGHSSSQRTSVPGTLNAQPAGPKLKNRQGKGNQTRLILIGIISAVCTMGAAILTVHLLRNSGNKSEFGPNVPPVADPVIWLRSDAGVKTNRGETPARPGNRVDLWEDQAARGGANSAHYINTGAAEPERLRRLPVLKEISLHQATRQVLQFDGSSYLVLATDTNLVGNIPGSLTEHNQPQMTYGLIVRFSPDKGKRVLLGPLGNAPMWELFGEGGKLSLGSSGNNGVLSSVDLPQSDEFFGILLTIDNPGRHGQIHLIDSVGSVAASPLSASLPTAAALTRLRLGSEGAVNDATIFHGDVAEVFLYGRLFTAADRDAFRNYFLQKYGKSPP